MTLVSQHTFTDSGALSCFVNARFLTQPLTGVQRYAYNVCRFLPQLRLLSPGNPRATYTGLDSERIEVIRHLAPSVLWEQCALVNRVGVHGLVWSPGGVGPVFSANHVLTIHDACLLDHPDWWPRHYRLTYQILWRLAARNAAHFLTVSEFSRSRISEVLDIDPGRISVTPNGVESFFRPLPAEVVGPRLADLGIDGPYVLAVSAISERKNFRRLFEAWTRVQPSLHGMSLVVVGPSALSFAKSGSFASLPRKAIYLGPVGDQVLHTLYAGAFAFAYPSLYEGFGIPPLEAMACGTPVLTSDVTALPEVVADAALLVDPYDVDAIVDGLDRIVHDTALRERLRERGLSHVKQFTFENTARQTWEVLGRVGSAIHAGDSRRT